MALHQITKGLDLPITGAPEQVIDAGPMGQDGGLSKPVTRVALLASDYLGMKPQMLVEVGQEVRRGQPLFLDRKRPGVLFTSPGAGVVEAIHRGERRAFQSMVIALNAREVANAPQDADFQPFPDYTGRDPGELTPEQVERLLIGSGLWTAIRSRPFGRVAAPVYAASGLASPGHTGGHDHEGHTDDEAGHGDGHGGGQHGESADPRPRAIFVNAMDTNPLAADPEVALAHRAVDLEVGLRALTRLTAGKVYFCKRQGSALGAFAMPGLQVEEFSGPHPAGLSGTHIHFLSPVYRQKTVWYLSAADAIAIGALFRTGRLSVERVISLGGPSVKRPRLLRTRLGASVDELVAGELETGEHRVLSGSVLSGLKATGPVLGYLGRYAAQISALKEGREREFLGWLSPGWEKFSVVPTFFSALFGGGHQRFPMTTSTNGSERAMVPIGTYEEVFPLDLIPTYLLRALVMNDVERAEQLGVLELEEEDLALCTVVCPGKYDYAPILRRNLNVLESEG